MANILKYFLLVVLFHYCESLTIQAKISVNRTCIHYGHNVDCRFYSCFEERFPCGSTYWISRWGNKYCVRMREQKKNFDINGQKLIEILHQCILNKLIKQRYYLMNSINCEQLNVAGQRIVHECYMNNWQIVCKTFQGSNQACFYQILDDTERHDLTMLRTLASIGQRCTPKRRLVDMRSSTDESQCVPPTS